MISAELYLAITYDFSSTIREREFLYPWVVENLDKITPALHHPYLSYLKAVVEIVNERVIYTDELSRLEGSVCVLEIGAMDSVKFDDLRQFLVTRSWRAILVEPIQKAYERLIENYKSMPNIRCVRVAISDKNGCAKMYRVSEAAIGRAIQWGVGLWGIQSDLAPGACLFD